MPRVIHFEIHADDVQRAIRFYQDTLGWSFTHFGGPMDYYLATTGPDDRPGINGGLMKRMGAGPAEGQAVNAYVCTVDVEDLDAAMASALGHGGSVAHPRMPVPGVGWLGYVKDTEGNIVGMMQEDPAAR